MPGDEVENKQGELILKQNLSYYKMTTWFCHMNNKHVTVIQI